MPINDYEGYPSIEELQKAALQASLSYQEINRKRRNGKLALAIDNTQPITYTAPNLPKKLANALHKQYVQETTKNRVTFSATIAQKNKALLDALAKSEGTAMSSLKKLGYDKKYNSSYDVTLGYGAYDTPGHSPISQLTIKDLLQLQKGMLNNPKNKSNSSAAGRYQITSTNIKNWLKEGYIKETDVYNEELQDRLALHLLGNTIENYRAGNISKDYLNKRLARIWDSIPYQGKAGWAGNKPGTVNPGVTQNFLDTILDQFK